jgi:glycosyltransferase involved in cell wall biosynthesis
VVAIFYHPDAFQTKNRKLMGRNAAGESFLKGFFKHSIPTADKSISVFAPDSNFITDFETSARECGRTDSILPISNETIKRLSDASILYYPGPDIAQQARYRMHHKFDWGICGITHTTSSAGAMDAVTSWITCPVQPWDAVICTSNAVKKNVETVLQAEVDFLQERLGITKLILPKLPVIPLGIDTQDFQFSAQQRSEARQRISANDDTVVILYVGRLSFHAKAHPLAMYQALETATNITGKNLILLECGWHANEHIESAFTVAAKSAGPSITCITLDGRNPVDRSIAWASADIFCSLSDNIQETFGIVPVEAMAAGLPLVVSDWDGYKDTVRDGIDGFRIPTMAPRPGLAGDLAYRHALNIDTYDMYCGYSSSLIALHAQKLSTAFIDLIESPELRYKMGEAGKSRAIETYDWKVIIPRYQELWDEQSKIRLASKEIYFGHKSSDHSTNTPSEWPARLDPTISFSNYPTKLLDSDTLLKLADSNADLALNKLSKLISLELVKYASFIFPTKGEIDIILTTAESFLPEPAPASELVRNLQTPRKPYGLRGLVWLCKLGILEFS